jgi:hypothetical protein
MKKDEKMGFWDEVRELTQLIKLKLAAGHGRASLREAVKEQARSQCVQTDAVPKGLRGVPGPLAEMLSRVPEGQQVKMTAAEYRKLVEKQ